MEPDRNRVRALLASLVDAGVDFVVCGGVACVLQGVNRVTHDVDLDLDLSEANLARFVAVAKALALRPRIPEPVEALADPARRAAWIAEKQAVVFTLLAEDLTVDVFLRYPVPHAELRRRADAFTIGGRVVRVSSKADLIAAKRAVVPPRKQDLRDIEDLEELSRGG